MHQIALIAAMGENRVIGVDNRLPWSLPDDWANFRRVTQGKTFIMGRASLEYPEALVSDRRNIILSRRDGLSLPPRCEQAHSLEQALEMTRDENEVFILGGANVFEQALPHADYLYLTLVHAAPEGDAFFPEVDWSEWKQVASVFHPADDRHRYAFSLDEYRRVATSGTV